MNEKIIYTTKEILENIDNLLNKFKKIFIIGIITNITQISYKKNCFLYKLNISDEHGEINLISFEINDDIKIGEEYFFRNCNIELINNQVFLYINGIKDNILISKKNIINKSLLTNDCINYSLINLFSLKNT